MKKVLLSAFGCNPYQGSESAIGWNWAIGISKNGYKVDVLTRVTNKEDIDKHGPLHNVDFHFVTLPFGMEKLFSFSIPTMYLYYMLWQWKAYRVGKKLHEKNSFHRVHHVSWGSIQQGSFLYKIKAPFLFGPSGGGQKAPEAFKKYFLHAWDVELKREKLSNLFLKFNPACQKMLKKAAVVLVSNKDTKQLAEKAGAQKLYFSLDAAIAKEFFPDKFIDRSPSIEDLKILWVGRFMPRKGLPIVIEVMDQLRNYLGIKLTIVGDGELSPHVRQQVKDLNLEDSISFTGQIPFAQVLEYYKTHDLFILTSLRDSCPAQLIEAMAFNLPIVTLDLHGQGQIVTEQTGIKVPPSDPESVVADLSAAIVSLANDPERYQKMSKAAYEFSREQEWGRKVQDIVSKFY